MSLSVKLLHSSAVTLKQIFYKQISEKEEYGIGAWLQSYHDITTSPYITSSPVLAHSGQNWSVSYVFPVQIFFISSLICYE